MTHDAAGAPPLSPKQLVFGFMASAVVLVAAFLCGVLVGRGVTAPRADAVAVDLASDPTAGTVPPQTRVPRDGAPSPATGEILDYPKMLGGAGVSDDLPDPTALDRVAVPGTGDAPAAAPSPRAAAPDARPSTGAAIPAPPPGAGYTVQVAAVRQRVEAERMVKRLTARGYDAYVVGATNGAPLFRVRVGKFKVRKDAEVMASTLASKERFKPWITR